VRGKHNARVISVSNLPVEQVTFACLNVLSLHNNTDDVIECIRDRRVDIFCLTETWHDSDSACIGRIRIPAASVSSTDHARVYVTTCLNHGGVAVVTNDCLHVACRCDAGVHVRVCRIPRRLWTVQLHRRNAVYRPSSATVQQRFFEELAIKYLSTSLATSTSVSMARMKRIPPNCRRRRSDWNSRGSIWRDLL